MQWVGRMAQRHSLLLGNAVLWDAGSARAPHPTATRYKSFDHWCERNPGRVCDVWLSPNRVHEMVCDPALPLATDPALVALARSAFVERYGDAALAWTLVPWSTQGQQGVSAIHGVDLGQLALVARQHRVRLNALRPRWVRVLALTLDRLPALRAIPQAWVVIVEGTVVSALRLHRGTLSEVRSETLPNARPASLAAFSSRLRAATPGGFTEAPVFAMGHGLSRGATAGVTALGRLDGRAPPTDWMFPPTAGDTPQRLPHKRPTSPESP
jgi:hypothetical protein